MSYLPTTIPGQDPATFVPKPYYGYGSSNQVYSNAPPAGNLAPGEIEPFLQADLYVPDTTNDLTVIQAEIDIINIQIAALAAIAVPVSFTNFGVAPNAAGASVATNVITLQPADSTHPGGISTGIQSLKGAKTFIDDTTFTADLYIPASNLAGTTGVIWQAGSTFLHSIGTRSTFLGDGAGGVGQLPTNTTGIGYHALQHCLGGNSTAVGANAGALITSGANNTLFGANSGANITLGGLNTLFGTNSGINLTIGSANIFVGHTAGAGLTTEINCIAINNGAVSPPTNGIIIGEGSHTSCSIYGIAGVTPGGTPQMVVMDNVTSRLGTQAIPSPGVTTLAAVGASPNADAATISGSTLNLELASASFPGVVGTGAQTFAGAKTFNGAIIGGSTLTVSGGLSTLQTINLSSFGAFGTTGVIQQNGVRSWSNYGTNNIFLGPLSGPISGTSSQSCVGVGYQCLQAISACNFTTAVGAQAGFGLTGATHNTLIGYQAGLNGVGANNVCVGSQAGVNLSSGANNIFLGRSAGAGKTTESNNIVINKGLVSPTNSNAIMIGDGSHTDCFLYGVAGQAAGGTPQMVQMDPITSKLGVIDAAELQPHGEVYYSPAYPTATSFTFAASSTFYLVNIATTTGAVTDGMTGNGAGRLTYTGTQTGICFHIACTINWCANNNANRVVVFVCNKNGTVIPGSKAVMNSGSATDYMSTSFHVAVALNTGDYIELYCANMTNTLPINILTTNIFAMGMMC